MRPSHAFIPTLELLEARTVPAVIISEIMYNPASNESAPNKVEWVELYNNGSTTTLTNARLSDVTAYGTRHYTGYFTATIPAGGAVVVFPNTITVAQFRTAWGSSVPAVPAGSWGAISQFALRNSTNGESVRLHSGAAVLDEVNYRSSSPWPQLTTQGGPSIYLKPGFLNATANDNGANWRASSVGVAGARRNTVTNVFNGADTGSPGNVSTSSPERRAESVSVDVGYLVSMAASPLARRPSRLGS